jgi:opacity protein-like surface antigen
VFVYGPRPVHHTHYEAAPSGRNHQVQKNHLPKRQIDRDDSFAIGIEGGALYSGYVDGISYGDMGLGLSGRYRPEESVGLELELSHWNQTWSAQTERSQTSIAGSVELFAFPWTRVSPYGLVGLTYTDRSILDKNALYDSDAVVESDAAWFGPHAGVGLEFALGDNVALDLEARYTGYVNRDLSDRALPGSLTTGAALMFHF